MHRLTILLAEDEPVIALDIRNLLESNNFRVVEVGGSAELPDLCRRFQPKLAIINFIQPEFGNGVALADMLKRLFGLSVIMLSGARQQDIAASPDFDADIDVLFKPFTGTQLLEHVDKLTVLNS